MALRSHVHVCMYNAYMHVVAPANARMQEERPIY